MHLASVWVPFTSEAKEAVAHYDELLREMKLAVQECGRKLAAHLRARAHLELDAKRRSLFQKYIPEVAQAISEILGVPKGNAEKSFYTALPNFVRFADEDPPPTARAEALHPRARCPSSLRPGSRAFARPTAKERATNAAGNSPSSE